MKILFLILTTVMMSGCNAETVKKIEAFNGARQDAIKQSQIIPYAQEQYKAFDAYFGIFTEFVVLLKGDAKMRKKFNKTLRSFDDMTELCTKVLLEKPEHASMMKNCTKNRFFLCSEELRNYPAQVLALYNLLDEANQDRFQKSETCKTKIAIFQ